MPTIQSPPGLNLAPRPTPETTTPTAPAGGVSVETTTELRVAMSRGTVCFPDPLGTIGEVQERLVSLTSDESAVPTVKREAAAVREGFEATDVRFEQTNEIGGPRLTDTETVQVWNRLTKWQEQLGKD